MSLSSVLVMVVTLTVIGSIIFLGAILKSSLQEIQAKVDINVYMETEALEGDILQLKTVLENLPEVEFVAYTSRDQALSNFRERHKNDQVILQSLEELDGQNPLSAILNIKAKQPSQYEGIARFLEDRKSSDQLSGVSLIKDINYFKNKIAIDRLSRIIESSERLGFVITILLVILSILITFNTLRLAIYISREEIGVMRLVGASPFYIRGPFIIIGMMYGVVAGLLTLIIFYPATLWLGNTTENFFIGINVFDYYLANFGQIFLIIMGSGIIIGGISSYLAVMRYLKK